MSSFAHLDSKDLWEGLAVTVVVAVLQALKQGLTGDGFNLMAYDRQAILNVALNAGVGYFAIMFGTTKDGKLLGAVQIKRASQVAFIDP